jgi:glucosamine-6-phosphate deaminase
MEALLLNRRVFESDELMGRAAAEEAGAPLREVTAERGMPVLACFAAVHSQGTFLAALVRQPDIDWSKVLAVHLDEYFDLPRNYPNTFEVNQREHLFSCAPVPEANVHYINAGQGATCDALARAYERRLLDAARKEAPEANNRTFALR